MTTFDQLTFDDEPSPATSPDADDGPGTPLLLTVRQAAQLLGLGRTTVYELMGRGELEVVHIGRSARIPLAGVHTFVDRLRSRSRIRSVPSSSGSAARSSRCPSMRRRTTTRCPGVHHMRTAMIERRTTASGAARYDVRLTLEVYAQSVDRLDRETADTLGEHFMPGQRAPEPDA